MNRIFTAIKELRVEAEKSQKEIAEKLQMTPNNYSRLERGEISLTIDRLYEIAKIFNVSALEILEEDYENKFDNLSEKILSLKDYIRRMAIKGKGVIDLDYDYNYSIELDFAELKEKIHPDYYAEHDKLIEKLEEIEDEDEEDSESS